MDRIRHPKKRAFLAAYAECGTITHAAELADVARASHYVWLAADATYAQAFADAEDQAAERLEQEARRRAVEGVRSERPIYHNGRLVDSVIETKYSDTLLIFLMKGAMPDKYAERHKHEHEDVRKEAEKLAAKYGRPVEQVEQDLLLRVEAARPEAGR